MEVDQRSALACTELDVAYGRTPVVHGLGLIVGQGEVVALLGPSGSGKTTILSAVAGFLPVAGGEIRIDGRVVASSRYHAPPEHRDVAVVFQGYALWPHMTALETVAYPLRRRGIAATAARRTAGELLERLGIGHLAGRRPAELSGGEGQRVGLGRALARGARLSLFDEPTAHLDADLRTRLQAEIAQQHRATGAAALYATHDTAEALAIADRVAIIRSGRLVQVGPPSEVYHRPVDEWAARLTGPAAIIDLRIVERAGSGTRIEVAGTIVDVHAEGAAESSRGLVRPDWARLGGDLPGRITAVAYRGTHTDYELETPAGTVVVREAGGPRAEAGSAPGWGLDQVWLLAAPDGQTGP